MAQTPVKESLPPICAYLAEAYPWRSSSTNLQCAPISVLKQIFASHQSISIGVVKNDPICSIIKAGGVAVSAH